MQHDLKDSRLEVDKVEYGKRMEVGPRVVLDQERCVECTRCIRFCDEVSKTGELRMMNRGDREIIDVFPGVPLDNDYSVNTADICPVGALTEKDFRFKVRAWFLKEAKSICPGCSRGCNVDVHYGWHPIVTDYNGKAYRLRPRVNDEVNQAWMCDFGRKEYERVNDRRVVQSIVAGNPESIEDALGSAKAILKQAGTDTLIVASLESTLEEMLVLTRLGEKLNAQVVAVPDHADGFEDDLLIRADKHPNRKGAEWLGLLVSHSDLPQLLKSVKAVVIHRADILALDEKGLVREALTKVPARICVAANQSATTEMATHLLPGCSYIEKSGHWVNFQGRIQRLFPGAHMPVLKGAADDLHVLASLAGFKGGTRARDVFEALKLTVPALSGVDFDAIGDQGLLVEPVAQEARRR
jgi:NADH-quinone oxidoreductase subunit G